MVARRVSRSRRNFMARVIVVLAAATSQPAQADVLTRVAGARRKQPMKTAQYKWSRSEGWRPNLPTGEVGRQSVVLVFGARSLVQAGDLVNELRDCFKGGTIL